MERWASFWGTGSGKATRTIEMGPVNLKRRTGPDFWLHDLAISWRKASEETTLEVD